MKPTAQQHTQAADQPSHCSQPDDPHGVKCVSCLKAFAESDLEQSGLESGSGCIQSLGIKIKPFYNGLIFLLRLAQLKPDNQPSTSVMAFKK